MSETLLLDSQFWHDFDAVLRRLETEWLASQDWNALALLQSLNHLRKPAHTDYLPDDLVRIRAMMPILESLSSLAPAISPLLSRARACLLPFGDMLTTHLPAPTLAENEQTRFEHLATRLFAMHRFLNGESGVEQFGRLGSNERADIAYGLGLRLSDGSLLNFFLKLRDIAGDDNAERIILSCFEDDAEGLLAALSGGQNSLESFLRSRMILRYDPILSRKTYEMSAAMTERFARLGTHPLARRSQLDISAGARFSHAQRVAQTSGIRSLRGFAMLFDANDAIADQVVDAIANRHTENQKCLSLADSVIARLHGRMAAHWQMRLKSVFFGAGYVENRFYDERQFLGNRAETQQWENVEYLDEWRQETRSPTPGFVYTIRPGDRLTALARCAYGNTGDYRAILRQNPHITSAENLLPGEKIYFPESCATDSSLDISPKNNQTPQTPLAELLPDYPYITIDAEPIGLVDMLSEAQRESFCRAVNTLPEPMLHATVAVALQQGVAIVCHQTTLLISTPENEAEILKRSRGLTDPVKLWAEHIAAHVRGDIIVSPKITLPLARLTHQQQRASWISSTLRRVLEQPKRLPLHIAIHGKSRCVDVLDQADENILRIVYEDFAAMRLQPHRRLRDYFAPPIVQMEALMQVWLADLFGLNVEIAVPPIVHVNEYTLKNNHGCADFFVPMGSPVYAVMRGVVVEAINEPKRTLLTIKHHDGLFSRYSGLATLCVKNGQTVEAETMIARSGTLPAETEPFLRLEFFESPKDEPCQPLLDAEKKDYLDIIYNVWPPKHPFHCLMGA